MISVIHEYVCKYFHYYHCYRVINFYTGNKEVNWHVFKTLTMEQLIPWIMIVTIKIWSFGLVFSFLQSSSLCSPCSSSLCFLSFSPLPPAPLPLLASVFFWNLQMWWCKLTWFSLSSCCLISLRQSGWGPWMPVIAVLVAVTAAVLYPNLTKSSSP